MSAQIGSDFDGVFAGRRVLLTGHTGFKGGWMSLWLARLGAEVTGIALPPETGPSFFEACGVARSVDSRMADITDRVRLSKVMGTVDAEILIHMAAQPLVRRSYSYPVETFATNVMGTAHVLELAQRMPSLKAIIVVTSDKCYENNEWEWGYREADPLGGADPYSASKGCTEILAHAYRRSFFNKEGGARLATVRAGNVFGGGDWGLERLVPDIVRAAANKRPVKIRNPGSVRPWQHVLEPVSGYMALAARLFQHGAPFEGAWNFGPDVSSTVPVRQLTQEICEAWGAGGPEILYGDAQDAAPGHQMHEAGLLRLDSTKAHTRLGWRPQLSLSEAVGMTIEWYRHHAEGHGMVALTDAQLSTFCGRMDGQGTHATPVPIIAAQASRRREPLMTGTLSVQPGKTSGVQK
ncbi:CDP-glucose 4,6-dehydratase [uncultured Tateyamaria sp.]|uniref:CDP-glucose 4,6-dehydratase n=1 Tax=uncultured Tateyamaria sp. TaxID=455651 RepID=UPI00260D1C0F|nr:CDP-glucose 4,6-dehydratase [uncultured Tateyamaria sp.]